MSVPKIAQHVATYNLYSFTPVLLPRIYPMRFGWKTLELMPKLKSRGLGMPDLPESLPTGPEIFNSMSWHDDMDWSDAHLKPVLVYLKGNKSLDLPDS